MSVQVNHYFGIGHKFGYDEFYNCIALSKGIEPSKFRDSVEEEFYDNAFKDIGFGENGLTIISDGMCGGYVWVGYILKKSKVYEGFDGSYKRAGKRPSPSKVTKLIKETFGLEVVCEYDVFSHHR